jgi:hypothetical protein
MTMPAKPSAQIRDTCPVRELDADPKKVVLRIVVRVDAVLRWKIAFTRDCFTPRASATSSNVTPVEYATTYGSATTALDERARTSVCGTATPSSSCGGPNHSGVEYAPSSTISGSSSSALGSRRNNSYEAHAASLSASPRSTEQFDPLVGVEVACCNSSVADAAQRCCRNDDG